MKNPQKRNNTTPNEGSRLEHGIVHRVFVRLIVSFVLCHWYVAISLYLSLYIYICFFGHSASIAWSDYETEQQNFIQTRDEQKLKVRDHTSLGYIKC